MSSQTKSIICYVLPLCVAILALLGIHYGSGVFSCKLCGASRTAKWFYFFGIGGRYDERIDEGTVSKLIQSHDGRKCSHDWEGASGSDFVWFRSARWAGRGLPRHSATKGSLEGCDWSDAYLKQRAASDPEFARKLKWAIEDPLEPDREAFLKRLADDVADAVPITQSAP